MHTNRPIRCFLILLVVFSGKLLPAEADGPEVRLVLTSEETITGRLVSVTDQDVALVQDGARKSYSLESLQTLQVIEPEEKTGPIIRVTLRNGTLVAAQSVTLKDDVLTIDPRRQADLSVPLQSVRAIRFRKPQAETNPGWLGMLESQGRGDLIAVRRPGNVLDSTRGVILSIGDGVAKIELEGNEVAAPLEKLEGIIFAGNAQDARQDSNTIRLRDVYGSDWQMDSVSMIDSETSVLLQFGSGLQHEIPVNQLMDIRWASASSTLATLPTVRRDFAVPFPLSGRSDKLNELLDTWVGPRTDGKSDLVMPGGGAFEYRLEDGMQRLRGAVRREQDVLRGGRVVVRILADQEVIWEQGLENAAPLGFELPVDRAKRIRFEVDPLDDGDGGDLVRWIRPRLIK